MITKNCPTRFLGIKKATWDSILLLNLALFASLFFIESHRAEEPQDNIAITHAHAQVITPTPTPTQTDYIFTKKHGDIIYRIWSKETTKGKYPFIYCKKRGLVNDFGYGVTNKSPLCFNTFEDEVNVVEKRFEELEGLPLGEQLCVYNLGVYEKDCQYAEDILGL